MIWLIIGFIILWIIGSLSSSTSTSNRSNTSIRVDNKRDLKKFPRDLDSSKNLPNSVEEVNKVILPIVVDETYEEKHRRINEAIAERKRLENLEKTQSETSNQIHKVIVTDIESVSSTEVIDCDHRDHLIRELPKSTEKKPDFQIVKNEAELDEEKYVSTTRLGKIFGLKARPELFDYLNEIGLLVYENKKFVLTEQGESYGGYRTTKEMDGQFVVWNIEKINPLLNSFLKQKLKNFECLYHLTHVSNIEGVFEKGLYCHSAKHEYKDVSNNDVNDRREKTEKCHGKKVHDYVPFYFNVRNAMLYAVQKKVDTRVVILEMDKMIACLPYTIFSDRNAATVNAQITNIKDDLKYYNWKEIYSESWNENNVQNVSIMQSMMAECLILNKVPQNFIKTIHCQDREIACEILELTRKHCLDINVKISPELFF